MAQRVVFEGPRQATSAAATCAQMKDTRDETASSTIGLHGQKSALQVICLGSGGGPSEENVTGFLVRSIGSEWAKGSLLAVDAGSHLAPITRMLERDFPTISRDRRRQDSNVSHASRTLNRRPLSPLTDGDEPVQLEPTILTTGPFAGLRFPNESARANALHVLRTYISTYLITHPHLDHISGFAINTAAFHATSRPKTLAALPSTVDAIKQHIFNDVIWPNLSDEDGGVGFVTFQRLKEGGDVMVGEGEGRGYIEVCDGLAARAFKVSHGCCTKSPPSHQHRGSMTSLALSDTQPPYNGSMLGASQDVTSSHMSRSLSVSQLHSTPGTPGLGPRSSFHPNHPSPHMQSNSAESACVVDSTAYFLRDEDTQREVLIFGDVEPDSLSLCPRTHIVWQEAARKVAHDILGGIFIECSYDDSQADAVLFGHLKPKHLIAELQNLASMVIEAKATRLAEQGTRKRKRSGPNGLENFARSAGSEGSHKRSRSTVHQSTMFDNTRRRSASDDHGITDLTSSSSSGGASTDHYELHAASEGSHSLDAMSPRSVTIPRSNAVTSTAPSASSSEMPLTDIKVIIIHVKDTLKDGPHVSENILIQLEDYEARLQEQGHGLGCEFVIAQSGESYWF